VRPVTQEQWHDAVDAAEILARITTAKILLFLEMGRLFNLIDETGEVDITACQEIIEDARSQGIMPNADVMQQFIADS
jgi:hypothetical protein